MKKLLKGLNVKMSEIKTFCNRAIAFAILELFIMTLVPVQVVSADNYDKKVIYDNGYGKKEYTVKEEFKKNVIVDQETVIEFKDVKLVIPSGAVKEPVDIIVEELEEVNKLDSGMENITSGAKGYRFKPNGMIFEKEVKLTIPYDKEKIKSEEDYTNLYTYFFNEKERHWERLDRVEIDKKECKITSLTNHFTDFINSTLKLPSSPGPLNFNPTSIKDIKAGNPLNGIPQIEGLEGGAFGSAGFSLPLNIPQGRNGLTPKLSIDYNSGNGNGIAGAGFDLNIPYITIDTKFGVPNYDGNDKYLLNGMELVPYKVVSGKTIYLPRVEGSFDLIERYGSNSSDYYFVVTNKDGTKNVYESGDGALKSNRDGSNIYKWYIKEIIDTNGNKVIYHYNSGTGGYSGKTFYLDNIEYTAYSNTESGAFKVSFVYEDRDDKIIDGRGRFVHLIDKRLKDIQVLYKDTASNNFVLGRDYRLSYIKNDFGKSAISEFGEYNNSEGKYYYSYKFDYFRMPSTDGGNDFASAVKYGDNLPLETQLDRNQSFGGGGSLYVGIGPGYGYMGFNFSAGANVGFSLKYAYDMTKFIDINGDGLPDIINQNAIWDPLKCYLNNGYGFRPEKKANGINKLLNESFDAGFDVGVSGGFGPFSGSLGGSFSWVKSWSTFTDFNGDGFVDFIPFMSDSYQKGTKEEDGKDLEFVGQPMQGGTTTYTVAPSVKDNSDDLKNGFYLVDPVRKWKPYKRGKVNLSGTITKLDEPNLGDATCDGVRINIYKNNDTLLTNVNNTNIDYWNSLLKDSNKINTSILLKNIGDTYSINQDVSLDKVDEIFFKLNSIKKVEKDLVDWEQVIAYKNIEFFDNISKSYVSDTTPNLNKYVFNNKDTLVKKDSSYKLYFDVSNDVSVGNTIDLSSDNKALGANTETGILGEVVKDESGQELGKRWFKVVKTNATKVYIIEEKNGVVGSDIEITGSNGLSFTSQGESIIIKDETNQFTKLYTLTNDITSDTTEKINANVFDNYIIKKLVTKDKNYMTDCYTKNGSYYEIKTDIKKSEKDRLAINDILTKIGFTNYDTVKREIRYYNGKYYDVSLTDWQTGIVEDLVSNETEESKLTKVKTSFIRVEDFGNDGSNNKIRFYVHVFDSKNDFSLSKLENGLTLRPYETLTKAEYEKNLSYLTELKADTSKENNRDFFISMYKWNGSYYVVDQNLANQKIQDDITNRNKLQGLLYNLGYATEYFNGGVYNWYYGEWNGNYEWNKNLIGIFDENKKSAYFTGLVAEEQRQSIRIEN